jgi:hypothetical protein
VNEDERKGCPSASAFGQYNACPGSFTLNKAAPEAPPSPAAARGTRVHAACAGETSIELLAKDEQETVKQLLEYESLLVGKFIADGWEIAEQLTEHRFWDEATESGWSGKADRVYLLQKNKDKIALIVDFKSSRYTTRAQESLQLAALSTLVDRHYQSNLNEVHVALVFPDGYDQASYDADALETVSEECKGLVDRATITETQKRYPSQEACRWCNAKSICPETRGNLNEVSKLPNTAIAPSDLPRLLAVSQVAKMLIKDIEEQARVVLKSGVNVEGWELKEGTTRSKITDTQEVYRRAAVIGIDGEAFANSVSISKKDLEALLKEELGYKGKQIKETINKLTKGCTTDTVAAPSLKQKKG